MIEPKGIRKIRARADRRRVLVSLHDRIQRLEQQSAAQVIGPLSFRQRVVVQVLRRAHLPRLKHGMFGDRALAEERDRAEVLSRLRGQPDGDEPLAGVAEGDEIVAADRNRPEEPGLGVRHGFELLRGQLVAEDVRDAREGTTCHRGSGRRGKTRTRSARSARRSRTRSPAWYRLSAARRFSTRGRSAGR